MDRIAQELADLADADLDRIAAVIDALTGAPMRPAYVASCRSGIGFSGKCAGEQGVEGVPRLCGGDFLLRPDG